MRKLLPLLLISACFAQGPSFPFGFVPQSAASPTFGTVNFWVPMTGQTTGASITTGILVAGTQPTSGSPCTWSLFDAAVTVQNSITALPATVTVGATTFPTSTVTKVIQANDASGQGGVICDFTTTDVFQTAFAFLTPGPPIQDNGGASLFDQLLTKSGSGAGYEVIQLQTGEPSAGGTTAQPNYNCSYNIETNPSGSTTHSRYWPLVCASSITYMANLENNGTAGTTKADFYRLSDCAHLGSIPATTGNSTTGIASELRIGNNENGTSTGTVSSFEDAMLVHGASSSTYPLLPCTPTVVPTWTIDSAINGRATNGTSLAAPAITPLAAGDLYLVQACTNATSGTITLTSTNGSNTYTAVDAATNNGGWRCATFKALSVSGSADTITMHNSVTGHANIMVVDITGGTDVDQHSGITAATSGTGGAYTSASVTTTFADEAVIGFSICSSNACHADTGNAQLLSDGAVIGAAGVGNWTTSIGSTSAKFHDLSGTSGVTEETAVITVH